MSTTRMALIEVLQRCLDDEENEEIKAGLAANASQDEHEYLEMLSSAQCSVINQETLRRLLDKAKGL